MYAQRLTSGWRIAIDPENRGKRERWFDGPRAGAKAASVPGIIQQSFPGYHGLAWYWLTFTPEISVSTHGQDGHATNRVLLRFEAVDYLAEVWLNGQPVGGHEGGETPFTLDVTEAFRAKGENLLAVRVLNPRDEAIDGIRLVETPHSQKGNSSCGGAFNPGGIVQPVELRVAPAVRITDIFARPNLKTGEIQITVTLQNDSGKEVSAPLTCSVAPDKTGETLARVEQKVRIASGTSSHELRLVVKSPQAWELSDPFLYRVSASVETEDAQHSSSVRCGFREFCVRNGFFFLNGRRIFLRSCHTGTWSPISLTAPDLDLLRKDLIYAKACGFNCVRFLSMLPAPQQVELCDELGLMLYVEAYSSWWSARDKEITDREAVARRFASAVREMVLRDRNHPSVVIWGMLNEIYEGFIFRQAVKALPMIREIDPTRLVLLGSGRWDRDLKIGSVSNPGSNRWEYQWGAEGPNGQDVPPNGTHAHHRGEGDVHYYPPMPLAAETRKFIRSMGEKTNPIFISEGGTGALLNVVGETRKFEEKAARKDLEDYTFMQDLNDRYTKDFERLGLKAVYPFPEDFLRESQRVHLGQRRRWFDLVRANPNFCGHSLTSMLDGTSGEGLWSFFRELKPGIADALSDGWAPLRWCLFADPLNAQAGEPIQIEAVLANEDVLKPGNYPVTFRISGPSGIVWEKRVTMKLPARGKNGLAPMAVSVLREKVKLPEPGEYTLAACLEHSGAPRGERLQFFVSAPVKRLEHSISVAGWGIEPDVCRWLKSRGVEVRPFNPEHAENMILVGSPKQRDGATLESIFRCAARGATVLFLDAAFFEGMPPLKVLNNARCIKFYDWLYHKEVVAYPHPLFDGLTKPGILDWNYYDDVTGLRTFTDAQPDETMAVALAAGLSSIHGQQNVFYASGVVVGAFKCGAGRVVLSGMNVLPRIGQHPVAGKLMMNFVRYAQKHARKLLPKISPSVAKNIEATFEPWQPPVADKQGRIALLPRHAELPTMNGAPAILSNPDGSERLGRWNNARAKAVWRVSLPKAGNYRVSIEQACEPGCDGSTYTLAVGPKRVSGAVLPTKGWFDYTSVDLGVLTLRQGETRLELAPKQSKLPDVFMDVRRIRLERCND